jgi:hypothetical protein
MNMDGNEVVLSVLGLIEMVWVLEKRGNKSGKSGKNGKKKKTKKRQDKD